MNIKSFLITTCLLLSCIYVFAQEKQEKGEFFIDEVYASANLTYHPYHISDCYGFGIGIQHIFLNEKTINVPFGIEYNRTNHFLLSVYQSHELELKNVMFHSNSLSMSIGVRLNVGKKMGILIESGGFADLMLGSSSAGTRFDYSTSPTTIEKFKDNGYLNSTAGVYIAIGIRIPVSRYYIILKPEYKFGFNELYSSYDILYNRYFRLSLGFKIK